MTRATLLTDFGTRDGYVAVMKGVINAIAPSAFVDDASHDIPHGDIMAAAFALRRYWQAYPVGTVHIVVVDPGVGSERAAIAMEADGRRFVGPDNGVFTFIPAARMVSIPTPADSSNTFHGRDVFAPAAARLLNGEGLDALGSEVAERVLLRIPEPTDAGGEIIAVDHFGNLISNLDAARVRQDSVRIAGHRVPVARTYADGDIVAVINSDGLLEIAVRDGSAARTLGAGRGDKVEL